MLEIAIMIEGQNGLTWPRWQKIARLVEDTVSSVFFVQTILQIPTHLISNHWNYGPR